MAHLIVSFFAAFAVAFSVYGETSSLLLAFIAYSSTGTLVMLLILAATALLMRAHGSTTVQTARA